MKHTLVALMEDKPGVLTRVVSLFRRRNFNIESISVGHTEIPDISRMTLVVDGSNTDGRAGHEAALQADQRPKGERRHRGPDGGPGTGADQGVGQADHPRRRSCRSWTSSGARWWTWRPTR